MKQYKSHTGQNFNRNMNSLFNILISSLNTNNKTHCDVNDHFNTSIYNRSMHNQLSVPLLIIKCDNKSLTT